MSTTISSNDVECQIPFETKIAGDIRKGDCVLVNDEKWNVVETSFSKSKAHLLLRQQNNDKRLELMLLWTSEVKKCTSDLASAPPGCALEAQQTQLQTLLQALQTNYNTLATNFNTLSTHYNALWNELERVRQVLEEQEQRVVKQ